MSKAVSKIEDRKPAPDHHAGGAAVPIVAFTATGRSLLDEAVEAGCDDLIAKPVDPVKLHAVLRRYLETGNK